MINFLVNVNEFVAGSAAKIGRLDQRSFLIAHISWKYIIPYFDTLIGNIGSSIPGEW